MSSFPVGSFVTVYSFGVHAARVVEHDPVLTIQGRTLRHDGWVKVRLLVPRGPVNTWAGTPAHLEQRLLLEHQR